MIEEFSAIGYGCLRDVTVKLTPLHAFIGPNDSGKSTLLKAIRALCIVASRKRGADHIDAFVGDKFLQAAPKSRRPISLIAAVNSSARYQLAWNNGWHEARNGRVVDRRLVERHPSILVEESQPGVEDHLLRALSGARMIKLRPEELRRSTLLLNGDGPLEFGNEWGMGLAAVLDAIRDRNEDAWRALLVDVQGYFPNVRRLQLQAVGGTGKVIAAELFDGTRVGVDELSEGFLYYLAFAAMQHFDPVAVLCVEEPENGLHPARIREVIRILRAISAAGTQVLLTTHSPLVVNELRPEEVTVLTRPKEIGTVATRLIDVPRYRERIERDALLPGEFWVSYCDGELEASLLQPPAPET